MKNFDYIDINNLDEYYNNLSKNIDTSSLWFNILRKKEYGFNKQEGSFQNLNLISCKKIAKELDLNPDKTRVLLALRASFFPLYGHSGIKIINEFLKINNININLTDLKIYYIEYHLNKSGFVLTKDLHYLLTDLFSNYPKTPEAKLAKILYEQMEKIKKILIFKNDDKDLLLDLIKDNELLLVSSDLNPLKTSADYYFNRYVPLNYEYEDLSNSEKEKYLEEINNFIKIDSDILDGIINFIIN